MSLNADAANILIADDLPENRLVYESVLSTLGENLILVSSGAQALKQVLQHQFAVILLDVNMPDMNGFETARFIRGHRRSCTTPIIFLTAFVDEVRTAEGYASGAVDYLPTPIIPEILRAKVRIFVELFKMRQQVALQAEERVRHAAAEVANKRLMFLADAGAMLVRSLDFLATARNLVQLPVPFLADTCLLSFAPGIAAGETHFLAELDGENQIQSRELNSLESLPDDFQRVCRDTLESSGNSDSSLPVIFRSPGISYLAIPLEARGRRFAVLTLAKNAQRETLTETDVTLAAALGSRAAMALDNALLHEELLKADRQKVDFLSMLAHELRNPLAPICNAAQLLQWHAPHDIALQASVSIIDRQVTQMARLVDDLLDISRITSGKIRLHLEIIDVTQAVHQAIEASRPLIDARRHRLRINVPDHAIWIRGDLTRMTQVITNLLNNAAKYTDNEGQIEISLENHDSQCAIAIRDTGTGIAPDMLSSVFDLFTQAERTLDRSSGGLGIGLTLVRKLVEMHQGTVVAESDGLGQGSCFTVHLPTCSPHEVDSRLRSDGALPSQAHRELEILVVDDNVDAAETLATLLRQSGHQVQVAYDGFSGMTIASAFRPNLVFLDIGLPGLNGYEVARQLRQLEATQHAILIATSGYGQPQDESRSQQAGFDMHLVKPVKFNLLQDVLRSQRFPAIKQ